MLRRRRANDRMSTELAASADASAPADASAEEVAALRGRIQEAMTILKKTKLGGGKGGRQYLYQLPWYLLIGPPGAGKTTALLNSGLRFPLADRLGNQAVQGVGGTRNCDWWFTDEAVLIDTAGRFTTQDSDRAADSGAWSGFLSLLKRYRRRQPINGVVIAISLSDLMTLSEPDRRAQATAVRQRLRELDEQLGIRFPIYVMFTKGDLVAGFVEFFDDLGKQEREQVWGHTFPIEESQGDGNVVESFAREFDALVTRLNERLVERLHQEQDFQRRSMIFGFPQQIASLREPLYDFLREIFQPTRFESRPLLRGFYFASGTQEGNPIDRIMGAMASAFGIGRQAVTGFSGSGRSYFLTPPAAQRRLLRSQRGQHQPQGGAAADLAAALCLWRLHHRPVGHRHPVDGQLLPQCRADRRRRKAPGPVQCSGRGGGAEPGDGCRSDTGSAGAGDLAGHARRLRPPGRERPAVVGLRPVPGRQDRCPGDRRLPARAERPVPAARSARPRRRPDRQSRRPGDALPGAARLPDARQPGTDGRRDRAHLPVRDLATGSTRGWA